jgi:hypothetical protein
MKCHLVMLSLILLIPCISQHSEAWISSKLRKPIRNFFVMTNQTYDGILGGLSGANAKCLTDLKANNWIGKGDALLDPSTVRAFLCDRNSCQDPKANTRYYFAVSGWTTYGGASFVTDSSKAGPGDAANWSADPYFGATQIWGYWTGRAQGTNTLWPTGNAGIDTLDNSCLDWTVNSGGANRGMWGSMAHTDYMRWYDGNGACSGAWHLVCIVDAP